MHPKLHIEFLEFFLIDNVVEFFVDLCTYQWKKSALVFACCGLCKEGTHLFGLIKVKWNGSYP